MLRVGSTLLHLLLFVVAPVICEAADDPPGVQFAGFTFYDPGPKAASVAVSGTLVGEGLAYKNNTYSIICVNDGKECLVSFIEEIGQNQLGRLDGPTIYPVTRWTDKEIVAEGGIMCAKTTIIISRATQETAFISEPINIGKDFCKNADRKAYKWAIQKSAGWTDYKPLPK